MPLKYKRVLLKLSGEALAGDKGFGIDYDVIRTISQSIQKCVALGAQIGIVVGGGNFFRGRSSDQIDRTRADHMGMLATVMNALALADGLEAQQVPVRVQTAITMQQIAEPYIRGRAIRHLEKGRVVIFGCGTGNPYFSTDTASSLRAAEIDADIILKATMVDGVYDRDPHKYEAAVRYDNVSFQEVLEKGLGVMDSTAAAMCRDNNIPVLVFSLSNPDNILAAISGEQIGTIVKEETEMEGMLVSGVAVDKNAARIAVIGIKDEPGMAFKIFDLLAKKNINVDIILQSIGRDGTKDISFTVSRDQMDEAVKVLEENHARIKAQKIEADPTVAKLSIVGAGMQTHPGVAAGMFEALYNIGVNIRMIGTSEIRVTVLVDEKDVDKAMRAAHDRFIED